MKSPVPLSTALKMNRTLQLFREKAEGNRLLGSDRKWDKRSLTGQWHPPLFAKYPDAVKRRAWEHLSYLCTKHKARLEANYGRYFGILVATATRLALDDINGTSSSRKGFHRIRAMNHIRVRLGIMDKREDQVANNRRRSNAQAAACL